MVAREGWRVRVLEVLADSLVGEGSQPPGLPLLLLFLFLLYMNCNLKRYFRILSYPQELVSRGWIKDTPPSPSSFSGLYLWIGYGTRSRSRRVPLVFHSYQ
ncbi:hypothetical protein KDA_44230 [Dictyobacter alpinus]|uniref:Uncharacterized protein n=1 Tax=Dictyobacter alpinus TaxID=2014873 RepID=A0A402BC70_9CHLR|nr:hypothetical protein KDA_44230 [Dictyobacter alpinus]